MEEYAKKYIEELDIWQGAYTILEDGEPICSEEIPYGVILHRLNEDELKTVKEIEYKNNILIYHCIIDDLLSEKYMYCLYVPISDTDKELNMRLIQDKECMCYKCDLFNSIGEFTTIKIRTEYGTVALANPRG